MTHNILLTKDWGTMKTYLLGVGPRSTRTVDAMGRKRRERWLQHFPPFVWPGSKHSPTFCWMLCDPSVFYRIWSWPLAGAERTISDHDEKSLHRHTIPSFVSSKSPFWLQLGSRETPHASHPETEVRRCVRRNQHRTARTVWVRCEPSTPRRDAKTGELARNSRRRPQPFPPSHCRKESNRGGCLPGLLWISNWEGATRSVKAARRARTQSYPRSPNLVSNFNESWSPPIPPLVPDIVLSKVVKGRWTQEGYEGPDVIRGQTVLRPSAYVDLRPLGLTWSEERYRSFFVSTPRPRQGSAHISQSFRDSLD